MNTIKKTLADLLKNLKSLPNILALIVPITTVIILISLNKSFIKELDRIIPFWIFLSCTITTLALGIYFLKDIFLYLKKQFEPFSRIKFQIIPFVIFIIAATYFTYTSVEAKHRVQSDESTYLATAQNLYYNQLAGACNEGIFDLDGKLVCEKTANNFKAKIQAWLYTVGMPFFGKDLSWVFNARIVLYFLTLIAVWMAVLLWTKSPITSMLTSAFLMMQPTVMFQFRSTSVEPLYIFLAAISFILLKWVWQKNTVPAWILFSMILGSFLQTRQETVFCVFAFAIFSLPKLMEYTTSKDSRKFNLLAFTFSLTLCTLPILFTIAGYQGYKFQGGEFAAHGHFFEHMRINWGQLTLDLNDKGMLINPFLKYFAYTSLLGFIASIAMAIFSFKIKDSNRNTKSYFQNSMFKMRYILIFFLLYHIQSYMIFENVSGDFTISINQRYSLVILPFMAFFTAIFFELCSYLILKIFGINNLSKNHLLTGFFVTLGLITAFALTYQHKNSLEYNIMHRNNHLTTEEGVLKSWLAKQNDKPKLFVYARPWHFIGYGQSSYHYRKFQRLTRDKQKELIKRFDGEVYYVRGLDCWDSKTYHKKAIEKRISNVCDNFEGKFNFETIHRSTITNNYLLKVDRITGIKDYNDDRLRVGVFYQITPKDSNSSFLQYSYKTNKSSKELDHIKLFLNDSLIREFPFVNESIMDSLPNPNIIAGYNVLKYKVFNKQNKLLFSKEKTKFLSQNRALELSRMPNEFAKQSWGVPRKNKSVNDIPLSVAGQSYSFGIGTHAYSQIIYNIKGQFNTFKASIGLDDDEFGGDGVEFIVKGDNKVLYKSGQIMAGIVKDINLDISNINKFELIVDSLGDINFDHADWLNATVIKNDPIKKVK